MPQVRYVTYSGPRNSVTPGNASCWSKKHRAQRRECHRCILQMEEPGFKHLVSHFGTPLLHSYFPGRLLASPFFFIFSFFHDHSHKLSPLVRVAHIARESGLSGRPVLRVSRGLGRRSRSTLVDGWLLELAYGLHPRSQRSKSLMDDFRSSDSPAAAFEGWWFQPRVQCLPLACIRQAWRARRELSRDFVGTRDGWAIRGLGHSAVRSARLAR